ncbi:hypothetical protein EVC24_127 [Rhizobium phage RHph_I4]|nr:hypothetical protein EVC24_127 [Rhizobium phage RHph_I4]
MAQQQITREDAVKSMKDMVTNLTASIEAMERALSVAVIDDQPYVLVLDHVSSGSLSAMKRLGNDSWNMSAQGMDAATFSRANAMRIAQAHGYRAMLKRDFWAYQIASQKATIEWANEMIGQAA